MDWSIIVVTSNAGPSNKELMDCYNSIIKEIPRDKLQLIIVGETTTYTLEYKDWEGCFNSAEWIYNQYEKDFTSKPGWITAKKNYGVSLAKFDNCLVMHDYIKLNPGFYQGWEDFGDDWDVGMNIILNSDNSRYRDWCNWDSPSIVPGGFGWWQTEPFLEKPRWTWGKPCLMPYNSKNEHYYISGAYIVAKKSIMKSIPYNENLVHGQAEDVCHSLESRDANVKYKMNTNSSCQLLRYKDLIISEYPYGN